MRAQLRRLLFGEGIVDEHACARLAARQVLEPVGRAQRRVKLDVEMIVIVIFAVSRSLMQDHHVGERKIEEFIEGREHRFEQFGEVALLAALGVVCAYGFGLLMNLSSWPYALGIAVPGHEGALSFVAGAPLLENVHRFLVYTVLTSTGGWDTGRAITNTVALVVLGPAVLATLRRAARRAAYVPGPAPSAR